MKSINELYKYLHNEYSDLGRISHLELIKHNNINSKNYKFYSKKGKFVLRNFTDSSSPEKIEKICKILNYCVKKEIKVSKPIKNKGNRFVDFKNKCYLTEYYEGSQYSGTKKELIDSAENLAQLHKVLDKCPIPFNYRTNQKFYKTLTKQELIKIRRILNERKIKSKFDDTVHENFNHLFEWFMDDKKQYKIIKKISKQNQLIHNDFHPFNVIFSKGKIVAILDFNSMKKGSIIEDVAFGAFRFAAYRTKELKKIFMRTENFLQSYSHYNNFKIMDIKYLNYFIAHKFLERLSYILKKNYFFRSDLWAVDLEKNIDSLKLSYKLSKYTRNFDFRS